MAFRMTSAMKAKLAVPALCAASAFALFHIPTSSMRYPFYKPVVAIGSTNSIATVSSPFFISSPPSSSSSSLSLTTPPMSPIPTSEASNQIKIIQERFRVGDYYVWLYQNDKDGSPTSWEKYTITKSDNQKNNGNGSNSMIVVIEMATKFTEDEEYMTHHRMTINMMDHIKAYKTRSDWKLDCFEYFGEDGWKKFGTGDNVQAFEEKFDIFGMLHMTNKYDSADTCVVKLDAQYLILIRSKRHDYTNTMYAPNLHALSGVAVLKRFAEHSFSLISTGNKDGIDINIDVVPLAED